MINDDDPLADYKAAAHKSEGALVSARARSLDMADILQVSSERCTAAGKALIAIAKDVERGRIPDGERMAEATRAVREAQAVFLTCAQVLGGVAESVRDAVDAAVDAWPKMPPAGNA